MLSFSVYEKPFRTHQCIRVRRNTHLLSRAIGAGGRRLRRKIAREGRRQSARNCWLQLHRSRPDHLQARRQSQDLAVWLQDLEIPLAGALLRWDYRKCMQKECGRARGVCVGLYLTEHASCCSTSPRTASQRWGLLVAALQEEPHLCCMYRWEDCNSWLSREKLLTSLGRVPWSGRRAQTWPRLSFWQMSAAQWGVHR